MWRLVSTDLSLQRASLRLQLLDLLFKFLDASACTCELYLLHRHTFSGIRCVHLLYDRTKKHKNE